MAEKTFFRKSLISFIILVLKSQLITFFVLNVAATSTDNNIIAFQGETGSSKVFNALNKRSIQNVTIDKRWTNETQRSGFLNDTLEAKFSKLVNRAAANTENVIFKKTVSTKKAPTPIVVGTAFTTILSDPTETVKPALQPAFSRRPSSRGNVYMILGITALVILITAIVVILVIYGVRRSLKKQEMLENMLYENEMNTHAKLMASISTPTSDKIGSTTSSSVSVFPSNQDHPSSNDLSFKHGIYQDINKKHSSQNNERMDDQSPSDQSMKYYYNKPQTSNGRPLQQHTEPSTYYNLPGRPNRSYSLTSKSKEYLTSRYYPSNFSVCDNSFQPDQQRSVSCNDNNESNYGKGIQNHLKSPSSGYSREQSRGYATPIQTRLKPYESSGFKSFNQPNSTNSQAHFTPQSNASSSNYTNFYCTPKSVPQIEPINFNTANTHFSDASYALSTPTSAYQDSTISSSEQELSFTTDRTTPGSMFSKASSKVESPGFDLNNDKTTSKAANKRYLTQNYIRTPSINASVDIWAEKKKRLLDLTSNLNESPNNRLRANN